MAAGEHVVEMTAAEQQEVIAAARELAVEFDAAGAKADEENQFPFALVPRYKAAGLARFGVPKRYGGGGADIWTIARVSRALANGDPAIALAFNMHQCMLGIYKAMMTEEQREYWLRRIVDENLLMCAAFSEDRAGVTGLSDVTATPVDGGYRISGRKSWVTLSEAADLLTFSATVTDADGTLPEDHAEKVNREQIFIVDKNSPGVEVLRTWNTHGMRATGTQTVMFTDAIVPTDALVGTMRGGLFAQLEWVTMTFSGVYLGLADKAYASMLKTLQKKSLGATAAASDNPLREKGWVQHDVGRLKSRLEQAERLLEMSCRLLIEGRDANWDPMARPALLNPVKLFVCETAQDITETGMRLIGGSTFRRGNLLERLYRDARSGPFQPVTPDQSYEMLGQFELGLMSVPAPQLAHDGEPQLAASR
ncbi:acyl-CoA dehydrogenase family protein [Mycobacterium sp. E1747]|uniref:acyl-CoA dehydrogenase family protein n=1 Tax=Mycobacterium sp. E1747 TaxID=1834128 RepID=UPI0018D3B21D|nr:acyl-CoA dehydrogenase family protein [Mycobacterium sp. E1747]